MFEGFRIQRCERLYFYTPKIICDQKIGEVRNSKEPALAETRKRKGD
jgi:hypothetical protein